MKLLKTIMALALCCALTACSTTAQKAKENKNKTTQVPTTTAKQSVATTSKAASDNKDNKDKETTAKNLEWKNIKLRNNLDKQKGLEIKYPEAVQKKYGKSLKLSKYPAKIVDLSTSSLALMAKLNVKMAAVSRTVKTTKAAEYYKDVKDIESGMRGVDTEAVIALEPDLVIMSGGMKEKYGAQLEKLKIPVYYTSEGPLVNLAANQAETEALAEAFGGSQAKEDVTAMYKAAEEACQNYAKAHASKKTAIMFGVGGKSIMLATSKSYFGTIIKMLGFENAADAKDVKGSGILPSSLETLVQADPEVIFLIAPPTGYDPQSLLTAFTKAKNADKAVYEGIKAVKVDKIVALPGNYTTSRGLEIVPDLYHLCEILTEKLGK
ncbi:ABC transporter substrate-binding protein [Amygdalobacter indicium]|uniref:ABC transporter substrate-binding protein n=1 Tax=Amygdalobacter indicium TaxID=3029272 RepID=A0ABY8C8A4_9FIRM|nr:ABC transporter substrate-binding protein [Amygdalobacter indicium]WEG35075.1 ABC transporter substrate-binding protein [Amygdalobacter indicium]